MCNNTHTQILGKCTNKKPIDTLFLELKIFWKKKKRNEISDRSLNS